MTVYQRLLMFLLSMLFIGGCTTVSGQKAEEAAPISYDYMLGPGDSLDIFVWRNTELSVQGVPIRPDGKISTPLVEELEASGKTPQQLARSIEEQLSQYIKSPRVTVTVRAFNGSTEGRIRVIGEVNNPQVLAYAKGMTVLDVMITVGGLSQYAAGDRAVVVRMVGGKQTRIPAKLESLLKDGEVEKNFKVYPGDILIIPEAWF